MKDQIRIRHVRTAFRPRDEGPYRLPEAMRSHLMAALKPCRNRHAAFALATYIGQHFGDPARISEAFHVVRSTFAGRRDLGLKEHVIRAAITTLEDVGFLVRVHPPGTKAYPRKGVPFVFGAEYAEMFSQSAPDA